MPGNIFICPICGSRMSLPRCPRGHALPGDGSVFEFTDEPAISLEPGGRRWLGYEQVGENYDGGVQHTEYDYGIFSVCAQKLVSLVGADASVLDLGCGLGTASIPLAHQGARVIAADISRTMLDCAARRIAANGLSDTVTLARMNAYQLYIADRSLDAVLAIDLLHQLDEPEAAVGEIARVLRPDGLLATYGSRGLPLSEDEARINTRCGAALRDISDRYEEKLTEYGYTGRPFSSWDKVSPAISVFFGPPEEYACGREFIWTGKMRKEINKLRTRANGGAQLIPDSLHNAAWVYADAYARAKYGDDYAFMPGFSRFDGVLTVYRALMP